MRKVLISGAAGFLGSHVLKICAEKGYAIRGAVRNLSETSRLDYLRKVAGPKADLEFVEARLENYESWDRAVRGCDSVIHLAAPLPSKNARNEVLEEQMYSGIQAVLENSTKHHVKAVVVTGTSLNAGIYGGVPKHVYTESDWPEEAAAGYLRGKVALERSAWRYQQEQRQDRFRLTIIHPAVMYGPLLVPGARGSLQQLIHMLNGYMAYYHLCVPIVDVRDVALAHVKAMESKVADGKRYMCSGGSLWLDEIPRLIQQEFGKEGYGCKKMPCNDLLIKFFSLFTKDLRNMVERSGSLFEVSSELIGKELGVGFRPARDSVVDCVRSLIASGLVKKRK